MVLNKDDIGSIVENNGSTGATTALQPSGSQFQFSEELREFYESHNFDLSGGTLSCCCPYRYVRLNPRYDAEETLDMLRKEVRNQRESENTTSEKPTQVLSVPWLESRWAFYALPEDFSLSTSQCFRSGRIYGMDVSSGAGVAVLLTDMHDTSTVSASKSGTAQPKDGSLESTEELRILDLCCSPGLKLLQMADFFHQKTSIDDAPKQRPVKVVGVDICEHRINVCKSIVHKYFVDPETSGRGEGSSSETPCSVGIQLYLEDGTTFGVKQPPNENNAAPSSSGNLVFDSGVAMEEMVQRGGKRKRMNKSARAREKKRLRQIASLESDSVGKKANSMNSTSQNESESKGDIEKDPQNCIRLFDYVLVDAECSTDGSFKHIKERLKDASSNKQNKDVGHREENTRLTDPSKLAELVELQRKLIASGFRLLKEGGTLVYSTCSLSEDQNEKVAKWLLETYPDAVLTPIHFPSIKDSKFVTEGSLEGTVRFYPNLVQDTKSTNLLLGDGFFVAKIKKKQQ